MKLAIAASLALLLLVSTTTALSIIPTSCYKDNALYAHGDQVPDRDPCKSCRCDNGRVFCATPMCILPVCSDGVTPVNEPGKCCAYTCPPVTSCLNYDTGVRHPVGAIDDGDVCKHCTCDQSGQIFCASPMCVPPICPGNAISITKPGDCCPSCPDVTCTDDDGNTHPVGNVETNDPCESCQCRESGEIRCAMAGCAPLACPGRAAPVQKPGECCPSCPTCQDDGGNIHQVGKIETSDPCESCECTESGEIRCAMAGCAPSLCPEPIRTEGQCCATCPPGCFRDGKWYEPGPIPTEDPCTPPCFCDGESGNIMCAMRMCPPIRCAGEKYTPEGQCCPVCREY